MIRRWPPAISRHPFLLRVSRIPPSAGIQPNRASCRSMDAIGAPFAPYSNLGPTAEGWKKQRSLVAFGRSFLGRAMGRGGRNISQLGPSLLAPALLFHTLSLLPEH